ncbi:phosphoethanolamine transferase [Undibacterium sp. SXout7W]|uniref:phosphoethanolamine transferase n=1 Tax=Undibacterium sp. SXout7W TaxID=3413049 RepID=UPI003BF413A5
MRSLLRPAPIFLIASYLLLSLIPFFSLLLGVATEKTALLLSMELACWIGFWAVLQHPRWFHYLLLPAFLAFPVEMYLRLYFGQGISTHHLGIIVETSPKEALEFLGNKIWLLLLVVLAVSAWWWSLLRIAQQHPALHWKHGSRWLAMGLLLIGIGAWWYGEHIGFQANQPGKVKSASASTSSLPKSSTTPSSASTDSTEDEDDEEPDNASISSPVIAASNAMNKNSVASRFPILADIHTLLAKHAAKLPTWAKIPYEEETFIRSWPFGLVLRGIDFWNERDYLARLSEKSHNFKFQAHLDGNPALPQTIVMVIGESSRYDRWSLNGYERDTNPLLKQEKNLVALSDVVTAVSATRLSVPVIVSRKPAAQSLQAGFSEKSFLTAFKEAGFKTFWLSNQMSFGQFDTPTSVYANEADVTQFLNLGGFTNRSNYDQVLLEPMQHALQDAAPKKLIVLHTLGNHWNYSHRYPQEYDRWKPSLFGITNPAYTDLKNKLALNNSYDNSVLYVDWMLSEVIQQLKNSGQMTSLMYTSDHGQTLYDGSCNLAFHGHNTQYEFHIPAFVWYSDQYQTMYPGKISQLKRHQHARLSTENIFHSLLDMANIRYPDEHLDRSILSKQLSPHIRYVDSYGWTNYDNASFKGDCREVMANKSNAPAKSNKK